MIFTRPITEITDMKQLEVSFSEADMKEALEAYLNRHFVSHRQVRIVVLKPTANSPRSMTAVVVPIEEPAPEEHNSPAPSDPPNPPDQPDPPELFSICACGHPRSIHLYGRSCNDPNCTCRAFTPS
jgi:hypothetical protein